MLRGVGRAMLQGICRITGVPILPCQGLKSVCIIHAHTGQWLTCISFLIAFDVNSVFGFSNSRGSDEC